MAKPFRGVRFIDMFPGGAVAFRRGIFERHRFSEFFHGYAQGEDLEMSLRLRAEGKIAWCGDARLAHNHAPEGRPPSFWKGYMEVRNRNFIRRRYSSNAKLINKVRFWVDLLLLATIDWCSFMRRPLQLQRLRHMSGLLAGMASCLVSPPRFEEPLAKKRFQVCVECVPSGRKVPSGRE